MSRSRKICLILGLIASWIIGYLLFREPNQVLSTPYPQFLAQNWLILEGNSVKAINIPFYPKTAVYGQIFAFGSDLEWEFEELVREKYPEKAEILIDLALCESGWKHDGQWGDNYTSYGLFQFKKETFYLFCEGDWKSDQDQLNCAEKMIEMGLGDKKIGWYNCWIKMNLDKYL